MVPISVGVERESICSHGRCVVRPIRLRQKLQRQVRREKQNLLFSSNSNLNLKVQRGIAIAEDK